MPNTQRALPGSLTSSIVLCTHNGARFVAAQVESLARLAPGPDEIVVQDDRSVDSTVAIVKSTLFDASRLRIEVNESNVGVTRNFERALRRASGDVLFLCDQDDIWLPHKIATMLAAIESSSQVLMAYSDARLIDEQTRDLGVTLSVALQVTREERDYVACGDAFAALLRRNIVTGCTAAIRRELLDVAVPFPDEWMHDEWLAIIAAAIGKISHIDEPLVLYRQHGANQIGAPRRGVVDQVRWLMASRGGVRRTLPPRMQRLVERLERLGSVVSAEKLAAAKLALKHATVRASLPSARWRRLGPIWHEWRSGRYKTCSRGLRSLVADIFEPINQAEDSRRYSP